MFLNRLFLSVSLNICVIMASILVSTQHLWLLFASILCNDSVRVEPRLKSQYPYISSHDLLKDYPSERIKSTIVLLVLVSV